MNKEIKTIDGENWYSEEYVHSLLKQMHHATLSLKSLKECTIMLPTDDYGRKNATKEFFELITNEHNKMWDDKIYMNYLGNVHINLTYWNLKTKEDAINEFNKK